MIPVLLAILFVVLGTLAYVALRNAQDFSDANEIIPGVPTTAPKEWAGAHSPEARLHRRLRDAMEALRANAALDQPSLATARSALEQEAVATDERLIAAAALPKGHREEPIRRIGDTVESIEVLVASLVELRGPAIDDVERRIDDVRQRVRFLAEAHDELAALEPAGDDLSMLRDRIEEDAAARPLDEPGDQSTPGSPDESGRPEPGPEQHGQGSGGPAGH